MMNVDLKLFRLINSGFANGFFDVVMPVFTNERIWIPLIIAGLIILFWRGGKRGKLAAISLLVAVAITDPLAARIFKPLFGRIRPNIALEGVRYIWHCGGKFSFPSNHAANAAAMATAIGFYYRKSLYFLIPIALTVGFSRIYVGVHYPADVLGGFSLGTIAAIVVAYLVSKIFHLDEKNSANGDDDEMRNGENNFIGE